MAGIRKICKDCGAELNEDDKHSRCDECMAARRAKWKSRFKTGLKIAAGIGAVGGLIYLAFKSSNEDSDTFPFVDFDDDTNDTVKTDIGSSEVKIERDFICSYCGNNWSQEADEDGLCDGYILPPCPICETPGSDPNDFGDFVCPYCDHKWRNYGNGGLVLGCWPNCPKCGTMADEA